MKMNPKATALTVMIKDTMKTKPGMDTSSEDTMEDTTEDTEEGYSSVKCKCGCDVVCKDCKEAPENCEC